MNPIPKIKTNRSKKYLEWLRTQPCCCCGIYSIDGVIDVVAAHTGGGVALKGSDLTCCPLCVICHSQEHMGYETFWEKIYLEKDKTRDQYVKELQIKYEEFNGGV